ncbi:ESX secretion-associated protein EspG [Nocardia vermiculata]|uniref:ESX secretion-associated protein EspG n=1 Tax=Nocardia vermiculata TaxID=257274 RepID=A0A846Y461_9NOCA|nr:ESX secretion-associated protein EspG [Nocardia vermiculata]NKY54033.1 ESX secretion-associated protein EspG [Nocardia vermiculata]
MVTATSADGPIALELNVDAALLLKELVGIDTYPPVLALMPNVYHLDDRRRVHQAVEAQLAEAGVLVDGRVHPVVERWLQCLYRPDTEMVARIVDTGRDGEARGMLRMSLVRSGSDHVLAVRNDDQIVVQSIFQEGHNLEILSAAVLSAMGTVPPTTFEPWRVTAAELTALPVETDERRRAIAELGAEPKTAAVLARALETIVRWAEVLVIEHHDGETPRPQVAMSVVDTSAGRLVVSPAIAMDGEVWSTYLPGDDAALRSGIGALVELLPGRSWFETSRIG